MKVTIKKLGIELLWLSGALVFTLLICFLLMGNDLFGGVVDIHLHDTLFVIAAPYIWVPMFFIVAFFSILLKESRHSFSRPVSNWIVLIVGIIIIVGLNYLIITFSQFFNATVIMNSPFPGSPGSSKFTNDPWANSLTCVFSIVQLLILVFLLLVCYSWGKSKTGNTGETLNL